MVQVKRLAAMTAVCLSSAVLASPITYEFNLPNWTLYSDAQYGGTGVIAKNAFGTSAWLDITLDNGGSNTQSQTYINSQITQLKITAIGGSYQNTWNTSTDLINVNGLSNLQQARFVSTSAAGIPTLTLLTDVQSTKNTGGGYIEAQNAGGVIQLGIIPFGNEVGFRAPSGVVYYADVNPKVGDTWVGFQVNGMQVGVTPPSALTLAKLSDDVYNKDVNGNVGGPNGIGDKGTSEYHLLGISPVTIPSLTNAVSTQQLPPLVLQKPGVYVGSDGFKADVYKDASGQIVISVRGTNFGDGFLKNFLADASFAPNGVVNPLLISYVSQLSALIKDVHDANPTSPFSLTGHSMGGAVVQIVGKATGLSVTSFDAPGAASTLAPITAAVPLLNELKDLHIPTPLDTATHASSITNYRLAGDQISFIGKNKNGPDDSQLGATISVTNPGDKTPVNWLNNHDMTTLANQIQATCPTTLYGQIGCSDGYTNERNITGTVIRTIFVACDFVVPGKPSTCERLVIPGIAGILDWIDPAPGNSYLLQAAAGSPFIKELMLPTLSNVFGWSLQYHDQLGWSSSNTMMGIGDFLFTTDVDGLAFTPLDIYGNQTYNKDYFTYGLALASNGNLEALQTTFGSVPEPSTILLLVTAVALIGRRSKRKISC